jgi:CheY-like chemotaxis protein
MGPWDASEVERGRWIVLTVADTGTGMDPETLGRAFDPFFTTKEPGRGTGLGLSAVYGTVRAAKGRVRVQSAPGGGSVFELWFPRVEPAAPARAEPQNLLERSGGGETILLVEDEPLVRRLVKQTLERRGYRVVDARDPREALETAASHRVDVLITDVVMPHMSGLELADRLRRERPELRVVTMSGYAEELDGRSADAARREVFLPKPFGPEDLARAVRRALSER